MEGKARDLDARWCDECRLEFRPEDWVVKHGGLFFHPRCME